MTDEQLRDISPALIGFLRQFESHFENHAGVRHFQNDTRCLLSDMERKTAEPMALLTGVPVRNVQQFLKAVPWDHDGLVDDLQKHLFASVSRMPDDGLGSVAIIDATSVLKKGIKTPGVQRQYLGCVGKGEKPGADTGASLPGLAADVQEASKKAKGHDRGPSPA